MKNLYTVYSGEVIQNSDSNLGTTNSCKDVHICMQ